MAILFDDGSSEYLLHAAAVRSGTPLTLAAWFYYDGALDYAVDAIISIGRADTGYEWHRLCLYCDPGSPVLYAQTNQSGSKVQSSKGPFSVNAWHHGAGVFVSSTSRLAYLDGLPGTVETTEKVPVVQDETAIGTRQLVLGEHFSGRIAEVAVWNAALTPAEVFALARRKDAAQVRRESLVSLWRMYHVGDLTDIIGGYNMTAYNAPQSSTHPLIVVPEVSIPFKAPAANVPPAMYQYRRRRAG